MSKKIYLCTNNSCQLQCLGCYMNSLCNNTEFVDLDFAKKVLDFNIEENTECVFHGGEPFFLRDDKTIQKYIDLVLEYPNIKWSATTNLVYNITPKLLELFSLFDNKFIKTSWDVDNYRFKTKEQLNLWENNIKFLLNKGFDVEVLITVNNLLIKHKPEEIVDYFVDLGIKTINFERITENGRANKVKVKPTNRETDSWLYEVYKYNKSLNIPLIDELVSISQGAEPLGCRRRECMKCVTTINSNNTVGTCPNMAKDQPIGKYENNEVIYNDKQDELIKLEKNINNKCLVCRFYKICKAECCQLQFDETGCPGLTEIMRNIIK